MADGTLGLCLAVLAAVAIWMGASAWVVLRRSEWSVVQLLILTLVMGVVSMVLVYGLLVFLPFIVAPFSE